MSVVNHGPRSGTKVGEDGRPEVDHAIHMIIDVGRSVGRSVGRGGASLPSFLVQNTALVSSVEWPGMARNRGKAAARRGAAFHNAS